MIRETICKLMACVTAAWVCAPAIGASPESPAYKVNGKVFTVSDAEKKDQSGFYEIEKRKFDRISEAAREEFLDQFWAELSKKKKKTLEKTKEAYMKEHVKVSEKEINELLEKYKDHPQLSKLSKDEQKKQIREYLNARESQKVVEDIIEDAMKTGKLAVLYEKPKEPVFDIKVANTEPVRYGPKPSDIKPIECKEDQCPVTVIEYSETRCPFCKRMLPDTMKVLEEYKGKIRWYVRDFIVHEDAVHGAVAEKCALNQGKFWEMYYAIFDNQKEQSEADLIKRAESIGLDMPKFKSCVNKDFKKYEEIVRENSMSGRKLGVEGTPAFFINGRKLSGALPFSEFKKIIDEELEKVKKTPKKA